MKFTSHHPLINAFLIPVLCLLLLTASGLPSALAQSTTNAAPVAVAADPNDVSQFPGIDKLPGNHPTNVWNGLAGVWARAHSRWKTNAANDVGAVVFLGDSITAGWNSLKRDFPNLHVANRGIGGDITSGVLYRLQADVLDLKPAAIVLLIGTNDIGNNEDPADVAENIIEILHRIKNFNPNTPVIVCKTMPRGGDNYPAKMKKLNDLVAAYVKTEPKFAICDTWAAYANENGQPNPVDFNADRLHLNAAGYAVWQATLSPVIAAMNISAPKAE
jgi:lysophospholipase L1-like esterase